MMEFSFCSIKWDGNKARYNDTNSLYDMIKNKIRPSLMSVGGYARMFDLKASNIHRAVMRSYNGLD